MTRGNISVGPLPRVDGNPPQQTADRSSFMLATFSCAACQGTVIQKPILKYEEALGKHYILGHKAFALKEL